MSTPELKPCPFCGTTEKLIRFNSPLGNPSVQCLCIPGFHMRVTQWNTRHNPAESALNAAREALSDLQRNYDHRTDVETKLLTALAQISPQQSKTT